MSKPHTVTQPIPAANRIGQTIATANRTGPRMSLSKRRSASVGNKARLIASHQSVSGPVSSSTSSLATVCTMSGTASLAQHTDKVYSFIFKSLSKVKS